MSEDKTEAPEGIDVTKPIDLMTICAELLGAPNRFYSHGIEHAQIEAAELLLEHAQEHDQRNSAVEFLRGIAQGLGQGGVTARMRAVKALLKGGIS